MKNGLKASLQELRRDPGAAAEQRSSDERTHCCNRRAAPERANHPQPIGAAQESEPANNNNPISPQTASSILQHRDLILDPIHVNADN